MAGVHFLYGLAFIATGLILGLQVRLPVVVLTRAALAFLAAFAVLHGTANWVSAWLFFSHGGAALRPRERSEIMCLVALSLGCLLLFGVDALQLGKRSRWLEVVVATLTAVVAGVGAYVAAEDGPMLAAAVEATVRYTLALGASLLAAHALLRTRRRSTALTKRSSRLLLAASVIFVLYAVLAGIVVPVAPFFPASHVNSSAFRALTGIPVEIPRALCAISLGMILTEILVVEASRSREELVQLREQFVSVVAHDLRSPLATIDLTVRSMEKRLPTDGAGAGLNPLLDRIRSSSRKLDRMIGDLLDASRIQARQLTVAPKPTDMRALVLATAERLAPACGGHPLRVEAPDRVPLVAVDPDRVEQVLVNLLSNAGKYAFDGSEILVKIVVHATELELSVSNLGEEIPSKEAERIFTRFYRTKDAERRAPGLGVGLYVARGLVEAHGGRIWVESREGRNIFRFTLPRTEPDAPFAQHAHSPSKSRWSHKLKVALRSALRSS